MKLTAEKLNELKPQIEGWKKEHRDVFILQVENFEGIFRLPTKEMMNSLVKGNEARAESELNDDLLRLCILHPDPIEFDSIMDENWGLAVPLAKKLLEQTGITREARIKKL